MSIQEYNSRASRIKDDTRIIADKNNYYKNYVETRYTRSWMLIDYGQDIQELSRIQDIE